MLAGESLNTSSGGRRRVRTSAPPIWRQMVPGNNLTITWVCVRVRACVSGVAPRPELAQERKVGPDDFQVLKVLGIGCKLAAGLANLARSGV